MKCTASTNTWSHQRKRKRINQRLAEVQKNNESQAPNTTGDGCITEEGHCSMEKDLLHQLELLSVPCSVAFGCSISLLTNNDDMIIKKVKQEVGGVSPVQTTHIVLCLELLEAASDNDLLQQILQHIQNNIKLS